MCRHIIDVFCIGCLILSAQSAIDCPRLCALDDAPQYEQLTKDLGSADAAVRKAAAEKLATGEAIPSLVQAVGGVDDNVSSRAADILFTLMDSDKPEVAGRADAAVTQLEQSPDEAVARLVGGMLERREETTLKALRDLGVPASRNREGFVIRIYYGWKGGDEGFKHLRRLRSPLTLEVRLEDEPSTFDRGWQGPSSGRRRAAEGIPPTTVQGVVSLRDFCNLESISLTMLATKDDLVRLADLPQLNTLSLVFPDDATGSELVEVAKLSQLERLKLFKAPNLEEHLEALAALPALKSLGVAYGTSATASGLAHVSKFVQLETLTVANAPDLGACLPEFAKLPRLRQLALVGKSVTDSDLVEVGKMADLEDLMLQGTAVTDDGLAHLTNLSHLRRLLLPWTTITDDAIPHLQQLSALEILNVHGSFLSTGGVTKLSQYLPSVWMGDLAGKHDDPFEVSPGAPRGARTSGVGLTPAPSPEHCQAVREITRLGGMVRVSDERSSSDPAPEWRTAVVLGRSWRGGEEALALLAKLAHVSSLEMNTPVPNSAVDHLRRLVELRSITLRDTLMTDQGLSFLRSLPNLKSVALVGPFTDAAVPYLSHTTAEHVLVKETQISEAGRQVIQQALQPNLQTAKRVEQMNEAERARALVARACAELPTDPATKTQARSERNRARQELAGSAMTAIPLLVDAAQHGGSGQRIQALFVLHRLGSSNVSWGFGTLPNLEEVLPEVQEAFKGLASAEQPSALERTDEERALIELGHFGGRVTFAPEERGAYHVTIFSGWSGGDEGLSCLSHLHPLQHLAVYGVSVSAKGLAVIGTLTDLRGLHLALSEEGGQNLAALRGLKQLSSLTFTPVNDEALRGLVGVDSITSLLLGGVSDRGLQYVGQLPQLKSLRLYDVPDFTGSGLQYMAGAAALEGLGIEEAPSFTGAGLEHLAGLASLRNMTFFNTGVLGQSLSHLASLPGLEQLSVWASPVTEAGVRHIGQIKQLKRLSIVDSTLLDAHLKYLADLSQLERLDLNGNGISDEGIIYLAKLRSLEDIRIDGTFITEKAKAKLFADLPKLQERRKRIPPMQRDRDRREELPDVSPEYLAAAREIIGLGASMSRGQEGCHVLLFANWSGGDEKLALLEQLSDLRDVNVKVRLTDSAIPYLKKLKQLRSLGLGRARMSKDGIEELKKALPDTNVSVFHESQVTRRAGLPGMSCKWLTAGVIPEWKCSYHPSVAVIRLKCASRYRLTARRSIMFTKRRVIVLLCLLVLLGGCAAVYELFFAPYEAEAELMVLPRSEVDSLFDGRNGAAVEEDQAVIAQNMVQIVRSRRVIVAALGDRSVKDHPIIQKQAADPEAFVSRKLEVLVKQPGIIVVRIRDRHDPGLCADLANAIVHEFVTRVIEAERAQKSGTINRLDKHLAAQTELEKKKRSELEALCEMLGPPDRDAWAETEFAKVQAEQLKQAAGRSYEKLVGLCLLDAEVGGRTRMRLPRPVPLDFGSGGQTHGEVVRLHTSTTDWVITGSIMPSDKKVESSWDEENRLATFRRYEEEYQRNMADLGHVLGQIAVARHALTEESSLGKKSFDLEMREREIDLLREQVDELVRMRRRAELALESGSRVQLISSAVKPVSRRHWFGWRDDAG